MDAFVHQCGHYSTQRAKNASGRKRFLQFFQACGGCGARILANTTKIFIPVDEAGKHAYNYPVRNSNGAGYQGVSSAIFLLIAAAPVRYNK
ncbi:MAG TPA: hypothetical protein H9985_07410 [Candidatus Anaerofilum faecale]|nr:hypothetical protein [Anaerofilum sp. An201]HIX13416.1 hypothetical protein [Candidatus Anaerofilum faecale]